LEGGEVGARVENFLVVKLSFCIGRKDRKEVDIDVVEDMLRLWEIRRQGRTECEAAVKRY
jgi:hypothetical protein